MEAAQYTRDGAPALRRIVFGETIDAGQFLRTLEADFLATLQPEQAAFADGCFESLERVLSDERPLPAFQLPDGLILEV